MFLWMSYAGSLLWLKIVTFELNSKNLQFIFSVLKSTQASDCNNLHSVQKCFE